MATALDSSQPADARKPRRGWLRWSIASVLVILLISELFARFYLGLGDPILMMDDPQIEYLYQPSRTYHRFGNTFHSNAYSMRSDDFAKQKTDPRELRVLVIGDSVVNGGSLTDQAQLATSLLQKQLRDELKRPVVVGNISADSWGPENQLAYLKRFGMFDADVVVFVWNSEDSFDVPTFAKHSGNLLNAPDHTPPLALWDGLVRYLLPRCGFVWETPEPIGPPATQPAASAVAAMHSLIQTCRASAKVIVYLHGFAPELNAPENFGLRCMKQVAEEEAVPLIDSRTAFISTINQGRTPYRDIRHVNAEGQALMKDLIYDSVIRALAASPTAAH